MAFEFTAHNIRLDDGTLTKPNHGLTMDAYPWFVSARRVIDTVFPGDKQHLRLADLGCLEGGYSVEFARMGLQVLGIEVRESNFAACNYVKSGTNLPNLTFIRDNAWNLGVYGNDNKKSFWIQREDLLQAIQNAGFDLVFEQFDSLGPNISESMKSGYYSTDQRGTFIGIKTKI